MHDYVVDLEEMVSSEEEDASISSNPACSLNNAQPKKTSLASYMYNLKYNLTHSSYVHIPYLHRPKIVLSPDSQPAYLLGVGYEFTTNKKFLDHFASTVWMSYRESSANGKGDVGWGCMIRVVQMLVIEVLRRSNPNLPVNFIIELFREGKNRMLSLENICQEGNIKERWTGSNEILLAVSAIISRITTTKQKFSPYTSIPPTILSPSPSPPIDLSLKIEIFCDQLTIQSISQGNEKDFPKLVIFSTYIMDDSNSNCIPDIYTPHAKHLMRMPFFCGMIGGVSNQALYILGFQEDNVICLDPHYVQHEEEGTNVQYFKRTPRGLPFQDLSQSVSFCFFLQDIAAYRAWAAELCHSCKLYSPYLVLNMQVEDSESMIEKYRKRSEDFQVL